jgi:hypothetical protein
MRTNTPTRLHLTEHCMFQQTQTLRNELRAQREDDQQYLQFSTSNPKTIAARNSNGLL